MWSKGLVEVYQKHVLQILCKHLHADLGGISSEKLIIIMMMKNRKNFRFLSDCGKAFPELSWTQKCECRLEI